MALQNSGSIGATESCALSLKVPKLKLSGNSMKDIQMQHERDSLVDCINILWKFPDIRSECVGYLKMAVGEKRQSALGDEYFEQEVTTVGKLDEQWCVDYICNKTQWTPAVLGEAKVLDHTIVPCIMEFLLGANKTLRLSAACKRKLVCMKALNARCAAVNNRAMLLADEELIKGGQLNWLVFCYEPQFHNGSDLVTHIRHRPTGQVAEMPFDVEIDRTFDVVCNHHDLLASFRKGKHHEYKCHEFFEKDVGPHAHKHWNGMPREWDIMINSALGQQEVTDQTQAAANNAGSASSSAEAFISPLKQMQRDRLQLARRKMIENQEAGSQKKRKASLEGTGEMHPWDMNAVLQGVDLVEEGEH